ncbi:MAG: hypothetical protein ABFD18_15935 [Syntrophomonas sp.]
MFLKIAIKLVDIVACIHNANMIHQRIRPDNILVDIKNDVVKLTGLRDHMEAAMEE